MKGFDLSASQYNALRILRGADEPLACGQIADRMLSPDPDITRLLDRVEGRGLISRARGAQDRRVVKARITGKGLRLLEQISPLLADHHCKQFSAFGEKNLRQLIEWMERVRASI